jgi:hypothetical protein
MKRIMILILTIFSFYLSFFAAEAKNTDAKNLGNGILVECNLMREEDKTKVNLTLTVSNQNGSIDKLSFRRDFVKVGKSQEGWWKVLKVLNDFPPAYAGNKKGKIVAGDKGFKDQLTGMDFVFVKGGCYEMGDTLTTFFRRSFTTDFFPYFFIDIFCKQR